MKDVKLKELLEAGCHFGHKAERWHPRAKRFIYTKKDGIHIIDLAKTKEGLEVAMQYVEDVLLGGGDILCVGTKRQAKGIVKEKASAVGMPFFSQRWIGGFLTNWESVRKNIKKINRLEEEQKTGEWKRYPKHERFKLARYLRRLKILYEGVLTVEELPQALFIIDVKREQAAVREALRKGISVIGIVDSNSDPKGIDYIIPANDDAVGSIELILEYITSVYGDAKTKYEKVAESRQKNQEEKKKKQQEEQKQAQKKSTTIKEEVDRLKKEKSLQKKKVSEKKVKENKEKKTKIKEEKDTKKASEKDAKEKQSSPKKKRGRPKK